MSERSGACIAARDLPRTPRRRLAVVTCMDSRIDPLRLLELDHGDAHVLRNAGGIVTDDVLRSLAISHHLLGTKEAVVIGHTGCGMLELTNGQLRARIAAESGADASAIDFLPFRDLDEAVRASVIRLRRAPVLPPGFGVTGFVYDLDTGCLRLVARPTPATLTR